MGENMTNVTSGAIVQWQCRIWRVVGWFSAAKTILRDIGSDTTVVAPLEELLEPPATLDPKAWMSLEGGTPEEWASALKQYEVAKALAENSGHDGAAVKAASTELKNHISTIYHWIDKYRESPCVMAFLPTLPGPKPGSRFLKKNVETIVADIITRRWLKRPPIGKTSFIKLVQRVFRRLHLKPPSRKAIEARLRPFENYDGVRARHGGKRARALMGAKPKSHQAEFPLQEVQIDHTLIDDLLVTSDNYRDLIGRAWLSLAIDICTRLIIGYYFDYYHPDAYSVGLVTAHSMLDKAPLLNAMGIYDAEWGGQGKIGTIVLDNALEHKTHNYVRACENRGIKVVFREWTEWGAYIERVTGTLMRELHALPGTTRSNVKDRADYDSGKHATMTFEEANRFFVYKICKYNHTIHSALDESPWSKWTRLLSVGTPPTYSPPAALEDPRKFLFDVMPYKVRTVRRDGIHLPTGIYWTPELTAWLHNHEQVHAKYNRTGMSQIYVPICGLNEPLTVPYGDLSRPCLSMIEWTVRNREKRKRGLNPTELALSDQYDERAEKVVDDSVKQTKRIRNKRQRRRIEADRVRTSIDQAWQKAYNAPGSPSRKTTNAQEIDELYGDISEIPTPDSHVVN